MGGVGDLLFYSKYKLKSEISCSSKIAYNNLEEGEREQVPPLKTSVLY
jgi:hypothetical protein